MPVYKRKNTSGKIVWRYQFAGPAGTRENQNLIAASGFATKQAAIAAEVVRRTEELKKFEMRKADAAGVAAAMPTTLAMLLAEFMKQHAEENLAPKTVERYHEMVAYLAPELLAMDMTAITFCKDNHLPLRVFDLMAGGNLGRALDGYAVGTLVK